MSDHPTPHNSSKRPYLLAILALICSGAAGFYAWHWWAYGRTHISTDDAYVAGDLLRITPRITGTVVAVLADDTDTVTAGQILVELDPSDAQLAQENAEAQLAAVVRRISQML